MAQPRTIALDAMGGDFGPGVIIPGAAISLVRHPSLSFIFTGKESRIRAELEKHPELAARSRIIHTDTEIAMDDKPSQALSAAARAPACGWRSRPCRRARRDAAVSAGNTGALMAMAKLVLRPMAGIERPAIAALWPTVKSECIVLDVGANIGATRTPARRFRPDGRRHGARRCSISRSRRSAC